jgi:hypothetical protein
MNQEKYTSFLFYLQKHQGLLDTKQAKLIDLFHHLITTLF